VAAVDGKEVPWEQIVKGYEYEKGKFVVLKEEDFKRVDLEPRIRSISSTSWRSPRSTRFISTVPTTSSRRRAARPRIIFCARFSPRPASRYFESHHPDAANLAAVKANGTYCAGAMPISRVRRFLLRTLMADGADEFSANA